jgi:hypothetical protein
MRLGLSIQRQSEFRRSYLMLRQVFLIICLSTSVSGVIAQFGNYTAGSGAGANISTGDYLTLVGDSAGYSLTTGLDNTFLGKNAGYMKDTESDHVIIGAFANSQSASGIDNVYIGARVAMSATGTDNTVVGNEAGINMTTAFDATLIGEEAGKSLTSGADNTFVGEDAGFNTTTGADNTFIGSQAGRSNQIGYRNTAVGNDALWDVGGNGSNSHHNTAVGDSAGVDNGTGLYNTFIGAATGAANEHADDNTFVGAYAGWDNNRTNGTINANRNTYVGRRTGYTNREGEDNVGMGAFADFNNTIRSRTTFIGSYAKPWQNDVALLGYNSRSTKANGVGIGSGADVQGIGSIALGYQATIANNADNSIAIGDQTTVNTSNTVLIGNSSTTRIGGFVNWRATSDARLKKEVREDIHGLDFIQKLRPVSYQLDAGKAREYMGGPDGVGLSEYPGRQSGFLAQEVEQAAQEVGFDFSGVDPPRHEDDSYGLRYAEFVVPLVKAVQELASENERLKALIFDQQELLEALSSRCAALQTGQEEVHAMRKELDEMKVLLSQGLLTNTDHK